MTHTIDRSNTVVLSMDFQNDIVTRYVPVDPGLIARAAGVLAQARAAGMPVVHIVVRFRPGHPEVGTRGLFAGIKAMNGLVEGTPGAEICEPLAPAPGEVVCTKRRVGAFSGSDLDTVLRATGRTHLVLLGIATSGVVLSTIRAAADLDYTMHVVSDCCADADPEVHRVLMDKVFPRMATPIGAAEFAAAVSARP
ncbi:MAG: cysteine hydrolase family protein [Vicinamibacterales bacterium]